MCRTGWAGGGLETAVLCVGVPTVPVRVAADVVGVTITGTRVTGPVEADRCDAGAVLAACGAGSGAG